MAQWVPKVHFTFTLLLIKLTDSCISNNGRREATVMNENNTDISIILWFDMRTN